MAKTNWQDPASSEILSTQISGLQEAVGKLEESINTSSIAESEITLSEVFISNDDRCRIYQAPLGKRNWLLYPAPIIKKNGFVITTDFEIDYGGGAIIFTTPIIEVDTLTADATYTSTISGKQLSTEDYSTSEKIKLADIEAEANKYVHPATHSASMIMMLDSTDIETKINSVASDLNSHKSDTIYQTAGGTATTITLTISETLVNALPITFIASANNSGAATTINTKPLYKPNTTTAPTLVAGKAYTVWYNSTSNCFFIKASAEGNTIAGHVLAGDTFSNDSDTGLTGTMPNRAGDTIALSRSVSGTTLKLLPSSGYRDGIDDNVTITDTNYIASNIKNGVSIFGLAGTNTNKKWYSATGNVTANEYNQATISIAAAGFTAQPSKIILTAYNGTIAKNYIFSSSADLNMGANGTNKVSSIVATLTSNTSAAYSLVIANSGSITFEGLGSNVNFTYELWAYE
jgi:hypothetical protein